MQKDEQQQEIVIQYASYTFSDQERSWTAMEREAFAIVWAVSTFRSYLLGKHFVVRTDNSAAATLKLAKQPKLQRWAMTLAEFDFEVRYRPGKWQTHVDALSRLPVEGNRSTDSAIEGFPDAASAFLIAYDQYIHPSLP